ncbi:MAG TPA: HAD-IIIA family hydrolase [Candidatus Paceibacterota bacterium]|nr:HAD-IIIA family hydrolase [Candidatus Paceibacterota bacterium]
MGNPNTVKLLVTDVDGVLTDGKLYLDVEGARELKSFHVRDGMGLLLAREAGIKTVFLSGRDSGAIRKRAQELQIDYIILGSKNKEQDLEEVLKQEGMALHNVCFIGDDVQDLPLLRAVGFSASPHDAANEVRRQVDYVAEKNGGEGAVRDIVDYILKSKMGFREVTERLFAIEEKMDLFNRKVAGEFFWEFVRSSVRRKILGQVGIFSRKEPPGKRSMGYFVGVLLHVVQNSLLHNPFFAPKADVLFFGMNRRRLQEDGLWHDIYCDPLIEALEKEGVRCCMVERPPFGRPVPRLVKTRHLYYFDFLELCYLVVRRLGFGRARLSEDERAFLAKVQERLNEEFGTELNLETQLIRELEKEKILSWLYRGLLRQIAPKAVIVADLSAKAPLAAACKGLGIPLIELQQGAIHRYSLEYSYEGSKRQKRRVPDYFFAFGDFWKSHVALPLPPERVLSVGFPYYEQERKKYMHGARKNQIIFLSQPTSRGTLAEFAADLAREVGDTWHVVYKLHPEEAFVWEKRYPGLANSDVEVVKDNEKPLYQLFGESRLQVGTNSTALYEGLGFGLETYLLETPEMEMMYLLDVGYARKVTSVQEMQSFLAKQENSQTNHGEEFFRSGSLGRMVTLIKQIGAL